MDEESFDRYLTNQCSEEELKIIAEWLKEEATGFNGRILFRKYWDSIDTPEEIPGLSATELLDRTHHQINLRMDHSCHGTDKMTSKPGFRLVSFLIRIAAILFIPLFLASLLYYIQTHQEMIGEKTFLSGQVYQQVISPMGNTTRLELSDGSTVWLNHGSSLRFPLHFNGNQRTVELEGEAYFDVYSNPDRPFIVKAGDIQLMAIGTEFNVMAYQEENILEATLQSGKIVLQKKRPDQSVVNLLSLQPRQQARYFTEEKKIDYYDVDPANYTSWKDGKLVMMDDPLSRIACKLERWYNVDIEFSHEAMGQIRYSGTFTNETLKQVLDLLKLATPIDYKIYPREKTDDGTYSKPQVVLSMKKGYKIVIKKRNSTSQN